MGNVLVINTTAQETRVALVEEGIITEFYVERKRDRGIAGNVYKGRVLRVLPGMQAAFVDIGQDKAAFLYVADVYNQHEEYMIDVESEEDEVDTPQSRGRTRPTGPIEERLDEGQEILVQVAKEPIGTKGARITSHITLPGRFLVHMPTFDHIGISRRIEVDDERERLRSLVESNRPAGTGFIIRTASEGVGEQRIVRDLQYLESLWHEILEQFDQEPSPTTLYEDLDLVLRSARDLLSEDVDRLVVDDESEYQRLRSFVSRFIPTLADRVSFYDKTEPIFDAYGIEIEISRALGRKVWLRSGGYLVIDMAEALTAIDVNTGKFVGSSTLEDTIVQINLEAVHEVVYQLRLRNIGGLIIVDFIDMENTDNRQKVADALQNALAADRARSRVLPISEFGLAQITRKRVRESLVQTLCEPCFYCEGRGYIKSRETVANEILRELRRGARGLKRGTSLVVHAHPDVAHLLYDLESASIREYEDAHGVQVEVNARSNYHLEQFDVAGTSPGT